MLTVKGVEQWDSTPPLDYQTPATSSQAASRPSSKSPNSWNVVGSWWPELASALLAIVWVSILTAVLVLYNDRALADWPLGTTVTINTIVALLSTQPLTLVASLVIFTSLATSTLTQSAVTYKDRLVTVHGSNNPGVAKATEHLWDWVTNDPSIRNVVPVDQGLRSGLLSSPQQVMDVYTPRCQTSECHWPEFDTVALTVVDGPGPRENCAVLPNGVVFNITSITTSDDMGQNGYIELGISEGYRQTPGTPNEAHGSLSFNKTEGQNAGIFSFFLIHYGPLRATEVVFHYCIDTFNISTTRNVPRVVKSATFTKAYRKLRHPLGQYACYDRYLVSSSGSPEYKVGGDADVSTADALKELLVGAPRKSFWGTGPGLFSAHLHTAAREAVSQVDKSDPDYVARLFKIRDEAQWQTIKHASQNVANGITKGIVDPDSGAVVSPVLGTALKEEIYIFIRWEWLSLLAVQVVLSLVVLIAVMIETRIMGTPVIKGSILPAFFAIGSSEKAAADRDGLSMHEKTSVDGGKHKTFALMGDLRHRQGKWVLDGLNRQGKL
ncbi:hypothetical protein QBC44DRAFT_366221 [Cladorrhinum sp. PSN332]|nr:hypothetical protein QBC44DRAFT_366221 [Cladorrhinum sp. PSN332]